ncbi:MAG TPA: CHAD domain-containing protein [Acidothermaceae bacterium]|nr:CHAD domain-containing protein [Acidothermaceae bacterium]
MLVGDREYVAGDGTADIDRAVQKALARASGRPGKHVGFVAEPASTVRRTWLDTFDWRLHRAGYILQRIERSRTTPTLRLSLASGDDVLIVSAPPQAQVTARVAYPLDTVVPAGPMRTLLEPVVEMRALQPVATQRFVVRSYRVLNDDEKTVARVVIEHPAGRWPGSAGNAGSTGSRVSIVASRGYSDEAAATARIIAKVPGLTPSDQSTLTQALSGTARSAGDYSSKLDIALSRSMPTEYAVRQIMRALLDAAQRNVPGVVAGIDTEFLHDLRVAVRRARSTLKVTGGALPAAQTDAASVALKWLGDLTTPSRDLDVYLLGLDELASEVTAPGWSASQLGPFRDFLVTAQASERAVLVRSLRSVRSKRAFAAWAAVSTGGDLAAEGADATDPALSRVESVAKSAVTRSFKRVIKAGTAITAESPPSDLHDLRKRCKELRYSLEIFGSLHDPAAQRALIDDLKKLQDCLGEFQDTEVQQHAIRRFASQMLAANSSDAATVEAVMAMGRLADRLGQRQVIARGTFAVLFEGFAGPQPRAHLAALYERAS